MQQVPSGCLTDTENVSEKNFFVASMEIVQTEGSRKTSPDHCCLFCVYWLLTSKGIKKNQDFKKLEKY